MNKKIQRIQGDTFKGLDQLEYLNLAGNQIEKIDKSIFDDLINLKYVYLNVNSICSNKSMCENLMALNLTRSTKICFHFK